MQAVDVVLLALSILVAGTCCYPRELYEGSRCHNSDGPGTCISVNDCTAAIKSIKEHGSHNFKRCGFNGFTEIVCCPRSDKTNSKNVTGQPQVKSVETAQKSKKACSAYTKQLPIVLSYHIVNGEDAELGEFPHMAALGFYVNVDKTFKFLCGGTLISDIYVVTAAHCIINTAQNDLKIVRLGVIDVPEKIDAPDPKIDLNVVNVTVHEEYQWKEKFNDIALVKLEKTVTFNAQIRPACLYTQSNDPESLLVTGWGALKYGSERSNILQKAQLTSVPLQQCNSTYQEKTQRTLLSKQICAIDNSSDACSGDSGGPLQIQTNSSVLTIVGITSYGIGCGGKYPGIYTRISSYLDWIESRVWP